MPADLPLDHIGELSAWLAAANIDSLELTGPAGRLFLKRTEGDRHLQGEGATTESVEAQIRDRGGTVVKAPIAGVLLHRHPMHKAPLAPQASKVQAGQVLALLQIGALLVPVASPHEGYVGAMLAEDGALIGFADAVVEVLANKDADKEDSPHGN